MNLNLIDERRRELLKTHEDKLPITMEMLATDEGRLTGALLYKYLYNMGFRISTVDVDITKALNHLLKKEQLK